MRRLAKQGNIPSINLLVDLANLVSLRYNLPVAVFDQRMVTGTTTVRFAAGNERFTDLGTGTLSHPEPGEVVFVDNAGLVSARRWCWRQSDQSAARPTTVVQTSNNPSPALGKGGTCFGDSGGPIFLNDTNEIVGITSFGMNGNCKGEDCAYRADIEDTQDVHQ